MNIKYLFRFLDLTIFAEIVDDADYANIETYPCHEYCRTKKHTHKKKTTTQQY
jgi:hypothetical protein